VPPGKWDTVKQEGGGKDNFRFGHIEFEVLKRNPSRESVGNVSYS
jgi:hypothetical protein